MTMNVVHVEFLCLRPKHASGKEASHIRKVIFQMQNVMVVQVVYSAAGIGT